MKSFDLVFVIFLSIGAIQGIIYGLILWNTKTSNTAANRFLATILFFFSYRLFVEILKLFGLGYYDIFYHILLEYNWIYGALIYFFIKAYVTPDFKLNLKKDWVHFVPVIAEFIISNFIKSQNFYWDGTRESLSWLGYWGYVVWMLYPTQYIISAGLVIFYIFKSQKQLSKYDFETYTIISEHIKWIKLMTSAMKFYAIAVIIVVLVDFIFFDYAFNRSYHYWIFIGMALITYGLGLLGFSKKNTVVIRFKTILNTKEKTLLETISVKLKLLMTNDKLYRNPDLNLKLLSEAAKAKPYLVTKSLNLILNTKFNDFINQYRIEELKSLIIDPKNDQFTLLSLAFEVGFNSKASFNRAVKKSTGKPPSHLKSNI